jgi:hypothetical protein
MDRTILFLMCRRNKLVLTDIGRQRMLRQEHIFLAMMMNGKKRNEKGERGQDSHREEVGRVL